jgi:hypothetical protein
MSFAPPPHEPAVAGRRLADYVVLDTSPDVPLVAADYRELSAPAYRKVRAAATDLVTAWPDAAGAYARLGRNPQDETAHRDLSAVLARILARHPDVFAGVTALLDEADPAIWIDHVRGDDFTSAWPAVGLDAMLALPPPPPRPAVAGPVLVNVVIPFRDAGPGGRARNLLACLRALRDQDLSSARYRVTVVETDTQPRGTAVIGNLADHYLFGYNPGLFNKSWAVNLGLREASLPASRAELTCVLDADILVERSFLRVNADRLRGGPDALLPYQHLYALDEPSSARAISDRLGLGGGVGADQVDPAGLRGLLLRDPPGACLWARTKVLGQIGGFDERFEGWGGEDDDVVFRLRQRGELVRYDDQLLHLSHARPPMHRGDGSFFNAHLADAHLTNAWTGADGFGDPTRFAEARQ